MPGPKKDIKQIKKVLAYRKTKDPLTKKPFSFRTISRIMQVDVSLIHRWYKYGVDQLSTRIVDRIK